MTYGCAGTAKVMSQSLLVSPDAPCLEFCWFLFVLKTQLDDVVSLPFTLGSDKLVSSRVLSKSRDLQREESTTINQLV